VKNRRLPTPLGPDDVQCLDPEQRGFHFGVFSILMENVRNARSDGRRRDVQAWSRMMSVVSLLFHDA
jgi:hypothetical protein